MTIKNVNFKKIILVLVGLGLTAFILFFFASTYYISHTVKSDCQTIEEQSRLSCVDGLLSRVNNENYDFKTRNHYIWMLGQLGDEKALIVLKSMYTGNIPDKESLDKGISQYELDKAIKLIENQNNIVKKIWGY